MARTLADLSPEQIRMLYGDNFVLDQQEGPMTDQDLYDQFPMWGNENERRFDKYPAPMAPLDELPPPVRQGGGQPMAAQALAAPVAPEMQNYFQRTTPGNVGQKVSMDFAAVPQQGGGQALDYSSPIEIGGFGKGYRMKGDPTRIVLADGRIVRTGVDSAAEAKARMDAMKFDLDRRKTNAEIMKMESESRKNDRAGGAGDMPDNKLLQKDQRWVQKDGRWEAEVIPGSKLDLKQKEEFAKDMDEFRSVEYAEKDLKRKINAVLDDKGGFASNFGGYNALLTQHLPDALDAKKKIESIKADLKALGLNVFRAGGSIGAMTEKEWPIVEARIAAIGPTMSEKEAANEFKSILDYMNSVKTRGEKKLRETWGDRVQMSSGKDSKDKEALDWANRNPNDPRAAKIKERLGVR